MCDGHNFIGCKSSDLARSDENEVLYHCDECNADECEKCFEAYGDIHIHELVKMTYAELQVKNPAYADGGWSCDCRKYQGCPRGGKVFDDEFGLVFHDAECGFDLCEKCAISYRLL